MKVGDLLSIVPKEGLLRRRVGVAGADDGGIHEFIHAVFRHKQFRVFQFHNDLIPGKDVGHVHLEDVGPLLFQKRGTPSLVPGLS